MVLAVWRLWRDMEARTEAIGAYLDNHRGDVADLHRRAIITVCTRRGLPRRAVDEDSGTRNTNAG